MKNRCSECGGVPIYTYEAWANAGRVVALKCRECGMLGSAGKSDPEALLYWNRENPNDQNK